ncbi:MAG TPA: hypothetical protein PKY59_03800 [Pyrinomonadaceae bacterium]|nr:hypothetical protein [Pyrinomonadaceae bacterium]
MKKIFVTIILCLLLVLGVSAQQSTSFSYQGKLNSSSLPANGTYDFRFELFSLLTNGTAIGTVDLNNVQVTNGIFTVPLDFGANAFDGTARYLEISVKLPSESTFTALAPRLSISSVPYAIKAINADSATVAQTANNATSLGGITANNFLLNNGDGSQLVNVNGGFKWNVITADQQAQSNNGYIANSSGELIVTLPPNPQVGDVFRVAGAGTGGWFINPNNLNQIITSEFWTPRETVRNWSGIASSADGTKLAATVFGGQIYTSTDSGVTWTARESTRFWTGIASSSDGTKLAAIVSNGQIYTSTDSGVTWTARESTRFWGSIASSADGTRLVATVGSGQIYTSSNSGANWTARDSNRTWSAVASSADGFNLVATVNSGQIYTSTNGGVNWTARESTRFWNSIASSSDGTKLVATVSGGQIYTSTDAGVTWTERDTTRFWSSVASSSDGTKLIASVSSGQTYISKDSGITWFSKESVQNLRKVASSADGRKLVGYTLFGTSGQIHTSQAASGIQNNMVELVYIGNNVFLEVNKK